MVGRAKKEGEGWPEVSWARSGGRLTPGTEMKGGATMRRIATITVGLLLACLPVQARRSGNYHTYHARAHSSRSHSHHSPSRSTPYRSHRAHSYSTRTQPGVRRNRHGRIKRSEAAQREFERQTGYPHGRKGYVVDHIKPLACGGADDPSNMQWQTIAEGKAKDKWERKGCK